MASSKDGLFSLLLLELKEIILNYVYFNDLFNLRILNKSFKEICDQFKIGPQLKDN